MIFEFFALFCVGYLVGMSALSGITAAIIRKCYLESWSKLSQVLWNIFALANILCSTFGAILIFALAVVGSKGFDRDDFWIRAVSFCVGLVAGLCIAIYASKIIYQKFWIKGVATDP